MVAVGVNGTAIIGCLAETTGPQALIQRSVWFLSGTGVLQLAKTIIGIAQMVQCQSPR